MTKKLTWEVEKTSLVLKVSDSGKTTTWTLRPKIQGNALAEILQQIASEVFDRGEYDLERGKAAWELEPTRPMFEPGRTVDAEELAELQRYEAVQAESEEASRAAQAREVARLNIGAKWFEADDDDSYGIPIPDYDTGEVRPR